MQKWSPRKRIDQQRRLATWNCAWRNLIANGHTDEITNPMPKLQSRIRSQCSLDNPAIHTSSQISTSLQSLTNLYSNKTSSHELFVSGATMYPKGKTVPETKTTPPAIYHWTGSSWKMDHGGHWQAGNHSGRFVNEHSLEDITSRVNRDRWTTVNKHEQWFGYLEQR
jgi:hypothetical protein